MFVRCWIKPLSICSDHCRSMECRRGGGGGSNSGPGKNGRRPGESIPFWLGSTRSALVLVPTPSANSGQPIRGEARRYKICHLPAGWRPPGPEYIGHRGMEDDVWKGQEEGSVVISSQRNGVSTNRRRFFRRRKQIPTQLLSQWNADYTNRPIDCTFPLTHDWLGWAIFSRSRFVFAISSKATKRIVAKFYLPSPAVELTKKVARGKTSHLSMVNGQKW